MMEKQVLEGWLLSTAGAGPAGLLKDGGWGGRSIRAQGGFCYGRTCTQPHPHPLRWLLCWNTTGHALVCSWDAWAPRAQEPNLWLQLPGDTAAGTGVAGCPV